jgi:hypothetical protein
MERKSPNLEVKATFRFGSTKTICQLGFRCGQQSSQPATTASGFDRKATRNPQLHIVPSVVHNAKA